MKFVVSSLLGRGGAGGIQHLSGDVAVVVDEVHEMSGDQMAILEALPKEAKCAVVTATATPAESTRMPESPALLTERALKEDKNGWKTDGRDAKSYEWPQAGQATLVFVPLVNDVKNVSAQMKAHFDGKGITNVCAMAYRDEWSRVSEPKRGVTYVIVSTNLLATGVTLDLDMVTDLLEGARYEDFEKGILKVSEGRATVAEAYQRSGRVGRFKAGVYAGVVFRKEIPTRSANSIDEEAKK